MIIIIIYTIPTTIQTHDNNNDKYCFGEAMGPQLRGILIRINAIATVLHINT